MSCSKPLPPFVCGSLYYLNRGQLERFSITCRSLKSFIERYLHSKPYRVFDQLLIRGGLYALFHKFVRWHPNRGDYSVKQFLAGKGYNYANAYYSFAEMRPYFVPIVRVREVIVFVAGGCTYKPEHVDEMESIAYLWHNGDVTIQNGHYGRVGAEDVQPILSSPTLLLCKNLLMINAHFSFNNFEVLYAVKVIETRYYYEDSIDLSQQYWQQFLEQPGVKPVVVFRQLHRQSIAHALDRLYKVFSSAVLPNAFKIVFVQDYDLLIEFREANKNSGEILEFKKGLPAEYKNDPLNEDHSYTLERYSV